MVGPQIPLILCLVHAEYSDNDVYWKDYDMHTRPATNTWYPLSKHQDMKASYEIQTFEVWKTGAFEWVVCWDSEEALVAVAEVGWSDVE